MLPVEVPWGATTMVYVPVAGKVCVSINPPFVPTEVGATRFVPPGLTIDTLVLQQFEGPMVTLDSCRLIRWPALPSKSTRPILAAVLIVTVLVPGNDIRPVNSTSVGW